MGRKPMEWPEEHMIERYAMGESCQDIADELNSDDWQRDYWYELMGRVVKIHARSVSKALHSFGVYLRPSHIIRLEDRDFWSTEMVTKWNQIDRLDMGQIADLLGVRRSAVCAAMVRLDIPKLNIRGRRGEITGQHRYEADELWSIDNPPDTDCRLSKLRGKDENESQ